MARLLRPLVHAEQPLVVDVEALHRMVELEATQPEVTGGLARDVVEVGVVGVQRAERDRLREPGRLRGQPLIQRSRHAGLVGIGEEAEATHPAGS